MKLTLEQKTFYEYGRAVESLKRTIYETRETAIHEFGEPYRRLMMHEQKCLINAMGLAGKIHIVRQKRAACRAWIPPQRRGCSTCKHDGTHYKLCALCHGVGWPISWKPKKEGES